MAYTYFNDSKPDGAVDDGPEVLDYIRTNNKAIRDMIMFGFAPDWDYSITTGTGDNEEPQYRFQKNGTEWVRCEYSYSSGNVTVAHYMHSINSGSSYDNIGYRTMTYDSSDNCTATTWSLT